MAAAPIISPGLDLDLSRIPRELMERDHWVLWRREERDGKTTKIPYQVDGRKASTADPATWCSFPRAAATRIRMRDCDGLGFVLTEDDPFVAVDLDHCRDPESGQIADWARDIVDQLASYTEVSPSGQGLHIFVRGVLPPGRRRKDEPGFHLELYDDARYMTVTGEHLAGTPAAVEERQEELERLHERHFPAPRRTVANRPRPVVGLDDASLLNRARGARNGAAFDRLWRGDWQGEYESQSEADQGLCNYLAFWTSGDAERMDRLFRQSGLMRAKWERRDYAERTIENALASCAEAYQGSPDGDVMLPPSDDRARSVINLTELGNARRLVAKHGSDLRYSSALGWMVYDGARWRRDDTGEVDRRAKRTVIDLYAEAGQEEQEERRKALADHARRSETNRQITAMIALARSEPGIPVRIEELDRDAWVLNVANGTLDLKTGDLRPHRRGDMLTKLAPVVYDPQARAPLWERFWRQIMADHEELIGFARRMFGLCLTGVTTEQVIFILYGTGNNGKSTAVNTFLSLLGDYGRMAAPALLLKKRNEAHPTERADLYGARLVASVEVERGRALAEALVKEMTGGERMKGRFMRRDFFEWEPTHKLFLACNHRPVIKGADNAIWRRIRLFPFTVTIPEEKRDHDLGEKLRLELPGILRWAVEGCLEWQRAGLQPPAEVVAATEDYRDDMDTLGDFIAQECMRDLQARATAKELYAAYASWCERNGAEPESKTSFGSSLKERGLTPDRTGSARGWKGVRLRE